MSPDPTIEDKLRSLPKAPGVYIFKGAGGEILYIGKAKNLRNRVRNYFRGRHRDSPRNRRLGRLISDVETIVVPSEPQALLLENNLIKEHRPRFNILLRDDKSYPSIAVTLGERFPRVLVVRRTNLPGARYFGPYTDVSVLRRTLKVIRRIFTVRSCHYNLPHDHPERACLDYHIGRCKAPCVDLQSEAEYREMIEDVLAFLEGRTLDVRAMLRERMHDAANEMNYERAAQLRDSIRWLDQLEHPQTVELLGVGDADAIGYARDGDDAVGVLLQMRSGKLVQRLHHFLKNTDEEPDAAVLRTFLVRFYLPLESAARRAVLPFEPEDLDQLQELAPRVKWIVPTRGVYHRMSALADQNAQHLMESLKIESFETDERVEDPVYSLGRDLGLTRVPRSMVCIDISTNQGRDTVGSLVWFEAGRPRKNMYRRFRIKDPGAQQDDFAAIKEVVTRFITRRREEAKELPDLMVIDGGKGQLGAALAALEELEVPDLPLISLAKKEELVFLPGRREPLRLPHRSPSLRLLQRIRDEAHRFAITYSRKKRTERTFSSEILAVPGVGPARRRVLLERFGSLGGIRLATVDEIASLRGFSQVLAERIIQHLKDNN